MRILALLIVVSVPLAASEPLIAPRLEAVSLAEVRATDAAPAPAAAAETPDERARHEASLTWPGGPRSTYRHVVDPARRRAGDPARDIVSDRWPGSSSATVTGLWYLDGAGAERKPFMIEANVAGPWSDSSAVIAQLLGRATAIVSPEYMAMRMGARALVAPAVFGTAASVPPFEGGRSAASPWITLVQFASDSRGDDCVSLNRVGRAVSGCGDLWQDGIDPVNELACYKGKAYLRCHLWCVEQTEGRTLGYVNGPCAVAP